MSVPQHARPPRGRHRTLIVLSLALATIGAVLPFGIASEKSINALSTLEWVLAALALAALIGLVVELVGRLHHAWPLMLTGLVWAVITVYLAIGPTATWLWHLAMALMAGGYAILALTAWRLAARELS